MNSLKKDNKELLYKVVEKSTKHSYIKPKEGYILITKSKRMSLKFILTNVYDNFNYYYEITRKKSDDILSLWGKEYKLILNRSNGFNYKIKNDEIIVSSESLNYLEVKELILTNELKNYLIKKEAEITKKLKENNYFNVLIKLKLLKSKYGSYNVNKNTEYIVLNVFLATLEEKYTDYVIYHEYAHQKVKNHKKEFYDTLSILFKNHKEVQKELKEKRIIL